MLLRLIFCTIFTILLCGCSSSNDIATKHLIKYDFSQLASYRIIERDSELGELQSLNYALRNNIEFAIERQLDKRGLEYSQNKETDVLVSYYVIDNSPQSLNRYNKSVNFCHFCVGLYQSSDGKKRLPMKLGSLVIDLVDRNSKRSVWRSVSKLNIKTKDNNIEVNDKLRHAVEAMFENFPAL